MNFTCHLWMALHNQSHGTTKEENRFQGQKIFSYFLLKCKTRRSLNLKANSADIRKVLLILTE